MRAVAGDQGVASQADGGRQHRPILIRDEINCIGRQLGGLEWDHFQKRQQRIEMPSSPRRLSTRGFAVPRPERNRPRTARGRSHAAATAVHARPRRTWQRKR